MLPLLAVMIDRRKSTLQSLFYFPYLTKTFKSFNEISSCLQLCVDNTASTFYDWLGHGPLLGKAEPIIFGGCRYYEGVTCVQTYLYI
jgi:hypothetical protein